MNQISQKPERSVLGLPAPKLRMSRNRSSEIATSGCSLAFAGIEIPLKY